MSHVHVDVDDTVVKNGTKIIDIITADNGGQPFISLEYFPPRTEEGVQVRF
jgi:hypothetical protein